MFKILYDGFEFSEKDKNIIRQKIKDLKIKNSGFESEKYFQKKLYNLSFIKLLKKKIYHYIINFYYKKKLSTFIKLYDLNNQDKNEIRIHDVRRIYNFFDIFRKYKIKSVLELGSGASTLCFEFLGQNITDFHVFDQNYKIIEKVKNKIKNKKLVKFTNSKVQLVSEFDELFLRFEKIENVFYKQFDLIYIDAPVLHDARPEEISVMNYIVDILNKIRFKIVLFDKKFYNYFFLKNYLDKKNFKLIVDDKFDCIIVVNIDLI